MYFDELTLSRKEKVFYLSSDKQISPTSNGNNKDQRLLT